MCVLPHHVPGMLEEIIDVFQRSPCRLGNHDEYVDNSNQTPGSKENEGAPLVHRVQKRGRCLCDGEVEEPVETLRQSAAKGAESVGPEFCSEEVWESVKP